MGTMKKRRGSCVYTRSASEAIRESRAVALEPDLYLDLLGTPYADGGREGSGFFDCLGLALTIVRRQGYALPDPTPEVEYDPKRAGALIAHGLGAEGWREIGGPVAGCVIALRKEKDGHGHLAIALDGRSAIHTVEVVGASVVKLDALKRIADRRGLRFFVPHEALHAPTTGARLPATIRSIEVPIARLGANTGVSRVGWRVLVVPDPVLAPENRSGRWVSYREGMTARDLAVEVGFPLGCVFPAKLGAAAPLDPDAALPFPSEDADPLLVLGVEWRGAEFLIALAVGLILTAISTVLNLLLAPQLESPEGPAETASPTFDLSGLRNTARPGLPIGVIYGEHRVAGQIIQASFTVDGAGRSVLYVLISLGAGEIESIGGITQDTAFPLSGSAIPDDFEIDGNPASSFDCEINVRLGSNGQEPIAGFNDVIVNVSYNYTLTLGDPFIHETQDPIEAFEVLLFYPEGLVEIDDGDFDPRSTIHEITYEPIDGSAPPVTISRLLSKSTRVSFSDRAARVDNLPKKRYRITVERMSPAWPESDPEDLSKSVLSAVNEITYDNLAYPGTVLIGWKLRASEQLSGGIPTLTCTARGRKVWVWDGASETAPDFGTSPVWSDVPAWCVLDMLLHPIYGGGRGGEFTLNDIDLQSFLDWANHTETSVDDGRGGTTERGKCDMVWDTDTPLWDAIQGVAKSNWASIVPIGRKIMIVVDEAKSPVAVFGRSNTRDFVVRYLGKRVRMNGVDVDFFNEEEDWEADTITRTDDGSIFTDNEPERRERVSAVGVTRPAQAARLAQFRLNRHRLITKQGEFRAGVEAIHLLPGDVIQLAHENLSWAASGRAASAMSFANRIEINEFVTIASGTTKIAIRYTNGSGVETIHEATVANSPGSYVPGNAIFFSPSIPSGSYPKGAVYLIGLETTWKRLAKITSLVTDPDMSRTISWEEYPADDAVYDDDPGDVATATPRLPHGKDLGAEVEFEVVERNFVSKSGVWTDAIEVFVTAKNRDWEEVEVFIAPIPDTRTESTPLPWRSVGRFKGESMVIHDVKRCSTYAISAVPTSPSGIALRPDRITARYIRVNGSRIEPPSLADLDWVGRVDESPEFADARIVWSEGWYQVVISDRAWSKDWELVEFRLGNKWCGGNYWARMYSPGIFNLPRFPQTAVSAWHETAGPSMTMRAKGKNGTWSYPYVIALDKVVQPAPANTTFDAASQFHGTWSGTFNNCGVVTSRIELSGSNLEGYWESTDKVASAADRLLLVAAIVSQIKSEDLRWEEANFKWGSEKAQRETWADFYIDGDECREPLTWEEADMPWSSMIPDILTWEDWKEEVHSRGNSPTIYMDTNNGGATDQPVGLYAEEFKVVDRYSIGLKIRRTHTRITSRIAFGGAEFQERA